MYLYILFLKGAYMMSRYFAGRGLAVAVFVLLIVSLGGGVPAHADSIVYDLTGKGVAAGYSFQYTSQAFITSPLVVPSLLWISAHQARSFVLIFHSTHRTGLALTWCSMLLNHVKVRPGA